MASWPPETALSAADRTAAQAALNALGFNAGEVDGIVGQGTRAALRAWQKQRGRVADGHLDAAEIAALKAEAGA